jgi:NADPH-dependent curcumin reductase CurA
VLQSRHPDYQPGDYLFNTNGWQRCGLTGDGITDFGYMHPRRLDPTLAPLSSALGVMGMLGLTAYAGMLVQCQPIAGETVVVSAASGGVGQIAGQLAKLAGARVVGIAGDPKKVAFCKARLGFDDCVLHLDPDYPEALRAACPDGVDVYFENVGGKVFEGVLPLLNAKARITLCGMIAQYGDTSGQSPRDTWLAAGSAVFSARKVQVHPLFVGDYVASHQAAFLALMGDYLRQEKVVYLEDFRAGLEVAPTAFGEMLRGGNFGKTLVVVQDP